MKTKLILSVILLMITFGSCNTPSYLPTAKDLRLSKYGAHIQIEKKNGTTVNCELLAVEDDKLVLLNEIAYPKFILLLPKDQIHKYLIRYARPQHYGWFLLLGSLALYFSNDPLAFYLAATASTAITAANEYSYIYRGKKLPYDRLKMFARFPQGIPKDFDPAKSQPDKEIARNK